MLLTLNFQVFCTGENAFAVTNKMASKCACCLCWDYVLQPFCLLISTQKHFDWAADFLGFAFIIRGRISTTNLRAVISKWDIIVGDIGLSILAIPLKYFSENILGSPSEITTVGVIYLDNLSKISVILPISHQDLVVVVHVLTRFFQSSPIEISALNSVNFISASENFIGM